MAWTKRLGGTIDKTAHTDIRMSPAIIISLSQQNVKHGYKAEQRPICAVLTGLPFTSQVTWAVGRAGLDVQFASNFSPNL